MFLPGRGGLSPEWGGFLIQKGGLYQGEADPLELTSSGSHQNRQYASYWNAFMFLNVFYWIQWLMHQRFIRFPEFAEFTEFPFHLVKNSTRQNITQIWQLRRFHKFLIEILQCLLWENIDLFGSFHKQSIHLTINNTAQLYFILGKAWHFTKRTLGKKKNLTQPCGQWSQIILHYIVSPTLIAIMEKGNVRQTNQNQNQGKQKAHVWYWGVYQMLMLIIEILRTNINWHLNVLHSLSWCTTAFEWYHGTNISLLECEVTVLH